MPARSDGQLRRQLLITGMIALGFGVLHHADHIIRGNHVGWPLVPEITPFTFSLLLYPIALTAMYLISRGRAWAGSLAAVAALGLVLVGLTHLGPQAVEPIRDVSTPYENPYVGALAVAILFGLMLSLVFAVANSVRVRMISGRW